ncbi:MAG: thiamine-phosphate kinase [Firmicutes bacterium]|nr:thiamine-phosphate kinase [Bacillota bacterium]
MPAEADIIARIARKVPSRPSAALPLSIGDDAALLRPPKGKHWVLTCDAFAEDVHFLARAQPAAAVGYKALARAVSDLAAMGATPRVFLLTLGLPAHRTGAWLDAFLRGLARAARAYDLVLAGGDTFRSSAVFVTITVIGEIAVGHAIQRSGARPGDRIYLSGVAGAAELGLQLILRGLDRSRRWKTLLRAHFFPEPRLKLGSWLAKHRLASAMLDTSDGLSTDLDHLCRASGTGARIFATRLPVVAVPAELRRQGFDPLHLALHGAEDYELLFTVPRHLVRKLPTRFGGVPLTCIGEITEPPQLLLVDENGALGPLPPAGWDHFRTPRGRR